MRSGEADGDFCAGDWNDDDNDDEHANGGGGDDGASGTVDMDHADHRWLTASESNPVAVRTLSPGHRTPIGYFFPIARFPAKNRVNIAPHSSALIPATISTR